ncbi:MAG: hypothetical protein ONB11_03395 [candidate division KSB1 bacterium]|nr:hypothetical protein [candidate division KSB1 bacterium]MDZ7340674.1 hypothetical protein [candidate division KSB1 bacterium]
MEQEQVKQAYDFGVDRYIESRLARVDDFVKRHFSFRGALKLHRKALGKDLYKGPLNIVWAAPYTAAKVMAVALRKCGFNSVSSYMDKLPRGFETNVQQEISWLIYTELLEIPYIQGRRRATKDALLEHILEQPEVSAAIMEQLETIAARASETHFRQLLERNLMEYGCSRTATAELAGSIVTLATGAALFKKMTPGAMATGAAIASALAQQAAVSHFFLGPTLGALYYSVFPATVSAGLLVATTGAVMAALSLVTSFAGVIIDPLQARLGLHQQRLKKFIHSLEHELKGRGDSRLELKAQYVARVFDILDLLKVAALRRG